MDIATILGFVLALLAIVYAIVGGGSSFGAFVDLPAVACVFGGAFAATLLCFPLKRVASVLKVARKAFVNETEDPRRLIDVMVGLAETARRDGVLSLETRQTEISNNFLRLGIQMTVDGTRPEVIEEVLRTEMNGVATRHRDGKGVLDQLGRFGPAYGMIGTLIGLVIMLSNMNNPEQIGPGMAIALLTTLYGALLSNVLCLPIAEKLAFINREELVAMEIILRGVMSIQAGDNPRVIQQKLLTFLPPQDRSIGRWEAA